MDELAVYGLVVAALGLLEGDLRFFQVGGSVGAVDGVEDRALFHGVALFKISGEHFAVHQRFHGVSIGRVQGAGAAEGVGDIPLLRRRFHIAGVHIGLLVVGGLEQEHPSCKDDHRRRDQPFPVLPGKCFGPGKLPGGLIVCSRCRGGVPLHGRVLLFPDHAFPPRCAVRGASSPSRRSVCYKVVYRISGN